jgi:putative transposase
MGWFVISQIFSVLLELIILSSQSEKNKDLEILLLRRQLALVERKQGKPVRVSRAERMPIAVLAMKLKESTGQTAQQMKRVIRIFQPETVFKWHREMARRKWTYNKQGGEDDRERTKRLSNWCCV